MPTTRTIHANLRRIASIVLASAACVPLAPFALATAGSQSDGTGLVSLADDEARLERIGYKLATANAARCGGVERLSGLALHDAASYDPRYREAATRAYGFTYGFGVRRVIPGSDAERAGLVPGDEILAVNGQDLRSFESEMIGRRATYQRTEAFTDLLTAALRRGRTNLTIRNGSNDRLVVLAGDAACGGQFVVSRSNALNAWSDGKYVAVTRKMMRVAKSDDELAFVIAHEMSHNILGHNAGHAPSRLFAELGFGAKEVKAAEVDADAMAVELIAKAGYDLHAPKRFLTASGKMRWMDLPITHPSTKRRIAIVNDAISRLGRASTRGNVDVDTAMAGAQPWLPLRLSRQIAQAPGETQRQTPAISLSTEIGPSLSHSIGEPRKNNDLTTLASITPLRVIRRMSGAELLRVSGLGGVYARSGADRPFTQVEWPADRMTLGGWDRRSVLFDVLQLHEFASGSIRAKS